MNGVPAAFTAGASALQNRQAPALKSTTDPVAARKAAVELEGFFLSQVLDNMFKGIKTDGIFGGGHGESIYRTFMTQEYGKLIAGRGGIGLADAIVRSMLTTQEIELTTQEIE